MSNVANISDAVYLDDKYKSNLTQFDLFDRVVNVRIGMYYKEEVSVKDENGTIKTELVDKYIYSYVIRSDYEIVYPNGSVEKIITSGLKGVNYNYYIRKCSYKPSIKIEYKVVDQTNHTEVNVYIRNFYRIINNKIAMSFFSEQNSTDRKYFSRVELQLGYFGQFAGLPHETIDDLSVLHTGNGIETITINDVYYVTVDNMPPDYTLKIHGFVGAGVAVSDTGKDAIDKRKEQYITNSNSVSYISYEDFVKEQYIDSLTLKKGSTIDAVLEDVILNNFSSVGDIYITTVARDYMNKILGDVINNPATGKGQTVLDSIYGLVDTNTVLNTLVTEILDKFSNGQLSVKRQWNYMGKVLLLYRSDEIDLRDSMFALEKTVNSVRTMLTASEQMTNKLYEEVTDSEGNKKRIDRSGITYYGHKLPAVYNINHAALTTISAPYFYFINPFDYVIFVSNYSTSEMVNFYINKINSTTGFTDSGTLSKGRYLIIKQTVTFATVEDANEMILTCAYTSNMSDTAFNDLMNNTASKTK